MRKQTTTFTIEIVSFTHINQNTEKQTKLSELCLTSRGSGVRIPQLPQDKSKKAAFERLFYFYPFPLHDGKQTIVKPLSFPQTNPPVSCNRLLCYSIKQRPYATDILISVIPSGIIKKSLYIGVCSTANYRK
jgi:hypothetical protein